MLGKILAVIGLAVALSIMPAVHAAHAAPVMKPGVSTDHGGVTLVGRGGFGKGGGGGRGGFGGGGGGGRGLAFGGGGGRGGFGGGGGGGRGLAFGGRGERRGLAFRGGGGGDKGWSGRKFSRDFKHRRYGHGRRKFRRGYATYGAPYLYGYGGYGVGCSWLYRKAIATGSPYWWRRYESCKYNSYD